MMRIAIIGSSDWQNKRKVQQTLQEMKKRFAADLDNLYIVGAGGSEGANYMVKKYAIEFGLKYEEYNPSFSGYNMYSAMPEAYYGKTYHFSQLHHRMKLIAQRCDYMMILTNADILDPVLKTAYNNVNKLKKPVVILA